MCRESTTCLNLVLGVNAPLAVRSCAASSASYSAWAYSYSYHCGLLLFANWSLLFFILYGLLLVQRYSGVSVLYARMILSIH